MEHTQRPYKESQETILDLEAEYRLDQRRVLRTQWAFWENQYDGSAYWGWGFANEMLPSRSHRGDNELETVPRHRRLYSKRLFLTGL